MSIVFVISMEKYGFKNLLELKVVTPTWSNLQLNMYTSSKHNALKNRTQINIHIHSLSSLNLNTCLYCCTYNTVLLLTTILWHINPHLLKNYSKNCVGQRNCRISTSACSVGLFRWNLSSVGRKWLRSERTAVSLPILLSELLTNVEDWSLRMKQPAYNLASSWTFLCTPKAF